MRPLPSFRRKPEPKDSAVLGMGAAGQPLTFVVLGPGFRRDDED